MLNKTSTQEGRAVVREFSSIHEKTSYHRDRLLAGALVVEPYQLPLLDKLRGL